MTRKIEFAPDAARFFARLDAVAQQRLADVLAVWADGVDPPGRRVVSGDPPAYRAKAGGARVLVEWTKGALRVMDLRLERRVGREA